MGLRLLQQHSNSSPKSGGHDQRPENSCRFSLPLRDSKQKPPTLSSSSSKVALIVASAALVITKRSFLSSSSLSLSRLLASAVSSPSYGSSREALSKRRRRRSRSRARAEYDPIFCLSAVYFTTLSRAPPTTTKRQKNWSIVRKKSASTTHMSTLEREIRRRRAHTERGCSLSLA